MKKVKNMDLSIQNGSSDTASVLLIDADSSRASLLKRTLCEYGYQVIGKLQNAQNLVQRVQEYSPDLLVLGVDRPDSVTLQNLSELHQQAPRPVVVFAEKDAPTMVHRAVKAGVSAYIVDDIQPHRFRLIIEIAIARFAEYQAIKNELQQTKTQLADQKLLERAKGLLMQKKAVSEPEAYQQLRKMAMDKGLTITVVAQNLVDVFEMLEQ
ncbi:MAG: ANTAR domain-containing protein [Proteobacteria bacterium]|nr:ANTAR domain-containing protein [Pseudomonadota bacterium]